MDKQDIHTIISEYKLAHPDATIQDILSHVLSQLKPPQSKIIEDFRGSRSYTVQLIPSKIGKREEK